MRCQLIDSPATCVSFTVDDDLDLVEVATKEGMSHAVDWVSRRDARSLVSDLLVRGYRDPHDGALTAESAFPVIASGYTFPLFNHLE